MLRDPKDIAPGKTLDEMTEEEFMELCGPAELPAYLQEAHALFRARYAEGISDRVPRFIEKKTGGK